MKPPLLPDPLPLAAAALVTLVPTAALSTGIHVVSCRDDTTHRMLVLQRTEDGSVDLLGAPQATVVSSGDLVTIVDGRETAQLAGESLTVIDGSDVARLDCIDVSEAFTAALHAVRGLVLDESEIDDVRARLAAAFAEQALAEADAAKAEEKAEERARQLAAAREALQRTEFDLEESERRGALLAEQVSALRSQLSSLQVLLDAAEAQNKSRTER